MKRQDIIAIGAVIAWFAFITIVAAFFV